MATPPPPPNAQMGSEINFPPQLVEKVLQALSNSNRSLESTWDEVGFQQEERNRQLHDLVLAIQQICQDKTNEEAAVRDEFVRTIQERKTQLNQIYQRLNEPMPDLSYDNEGNMVDSLGLTHQLVYYEAKIEELAEKVETQTARLEELHARLSTIHEDLGEPLDECWKDIVGDLSDARVAAYEARVEEMEGLRSERVKEVEGLLSSALEFMQRMAMQPKTELDRQVYGSLDRDGALVSTSRSASCVGVSVTARRALVERVRDLQAEEARRENVLLELGLKLQALWQLLGTPQEEMRAFEASIGGDLSEAIMNKGFDELSRLQAIKVEQIKSIIEGKREEIRRLWEEVDCPEEDRGRFTAIHVPEESFTDELLELHEQEITALQEIAKKRDPIVKLLKKYDDAEQAAETLKVLRADPERLKRRGSACLTEAAKENKLHKLVTNRPKIAADVIKKLKDWKKVEGTPFMHDGVDALEDVQERERIRTLPVKKPAEDTPRNAPTPGMSLPRGGPRRQASAKENTHTSNRHH